MTKTKKKMRWVLTRKVRRSLVGSTSAEPLTHQQHIVGNAPILGNADDQVLVRGPLGQAATSAPCTLGNLPYDVGAPVGEVIEKPTWCW